MMNAVSELHIEHVAILWREVERSLGDLHHSIRAKHGELETGLLHQLATWQFVSIERNDHNGVVFRVNPFGVEFLRHLCDPQADHSRIATLDSWFAMAELKSACFTLSLAGHDWFEDMLSCRVDRGLPVVRFRGKDGTEFDADLAKINSLWAIERSKWEDRSPRSSP